MKESIDFSIPLEVQESDENNDFSEGYRIVEEDIEQIIEDLNRHDRLGRYSIEFQKLLDALRNSHTKQRELLEEKRNLQIQVSSNAGKVAAAVKLSQTDKETIEKLKQELESAWKLIDVAHTKEQMAHETLATMRVDLSKLKQDLEASKKATEGEQETGVISKNKEALIREKERLNIELSTVKDRLASSLKYQEFMEKRHEISENKISELTVELEANKTELSKEKRVRETLEEEVKELKACITAKDAEIHNQTEQVNQTNKIIVKQELHVREQKIANEKLSKELQDVTNNLRLCKLGYEQQTTDIGKFQQQIKDMSQELKLNEEEHGKMKLEIKKVERIKESLEKKIGIFEAQKNFCEDERSKLQSKIILMEKEVSGLKYQAGEDKKVINTFKREKDILTKTAQKAAAFSQEQKKLISLQELHKKKLQEEVEEYSEQVNRQKQELLTLQNEKDRLLAETVDLNNQVQDYAEQLRLKQMDLFDSKKRIAEVNSQLKAQLGLFEQIRAEKNQVSKSLVEAQDEINELKHKLKVKSYQVEQLKEDISTKEGFLIKEEFNLQKSIKEKEAIKAELQKCLNEVRESKERSVMLSQENGRLQKIIAEADKEKARLSKDFNQATNERDILGTQLVRRNDELSLLHEKVHILQCTLHKGEAQYDQRLEDIRLLKIEIKKLRQEKATLTRSLKNTADLRQEIFHLERDFTRERLKCRALEEELQNPLNVHRWRKLEGSDPTTFELIQKIHILQKRLLASNEEAIRRESQLKEMQRLYMGLRQVVARQPGPETYEKLKQTQLALRDRGAKLKCLVAELTVYENQITQYKVEIHQVNKEMAEMKKKFYEMKRREQKVKQRERDLAREESFLPVLEPITGNTSKTRFIGGGFNVSGPTIRNSAIPMNA